MKTKYTILILFAMIIAACTNENDADRDFTSVPLQITAQIGEGAATRVADKTAFADGDVIGIRTATANVPYTYDGTNWEAKKGSYYFESNTVNICAYYPYDENAYKSRNDLEAKDYLAVYEELAATDKPVSLTFKHVMSKLSFTFLLGEGYDDEVKDVTNSVSNVKIGNLYTTGTFDTETGTAVANDQENTGDVVCEGNYAIAFPYTDEDGQEIKISFQYGDISFESEYFNVTLFGGKNYNYTVTLDKTKLTISKAEITAWSTKDLEAGTKDPTLIYTYGSIPYAAYGGINKYALAFSDGSFENLSDPYDEAINKLSTFVLNNVVGVVFYTSDPLTDDVALARDYPECNHGLICAVYNAKTTEDYRYDSKLVRMHWQTTGKTVSIAEWFKDCTMSDKNLYSYTDITYKDMIKKILGYNNTQVLKAYNAALTDKAYLVRPIHALSIYNKESPSGASSWFMPSAYELKQLQDVNMVTIMNTLSSILEKDTEETKRYIPFYPSGGSSYTWSSTEKDDKVVWSVDFSLKSSTSFKTTGLTESHKNTSSENKKDKDGNKIENEYLENAFNVRPICAF